MTFFLLVAAAFAAGILNSMAGGGSFLTFPSLIFAGVPAVMANASSTVTLVPGAAVSALSYRADVARANEGRLKVWFFVAILGGAVGAVLLLNTSDRMFRLVVPWLLLLATLIFAFGAKLSTLLRGRFHSSHVLMLAMLFPVSVYGGYFGGGMGIMLLAAFRLYGLKDIHGMNGIKAIIGGSLNVIAAFIFIGAHRVVWDPTLCMMAAAIAGGYIGPILARRLHPAMVRGIVIAVGALMTAWFFHRAPNERVIQHENALFV